jgi:hypothetical protein
VGACTTAFNSGKEDSNLTKSNGVLSSLHGSNFDSFAPHKYEETTTENLTKTDESKLTKPLRKRTKGVGDTDTTGKHSTRFKAYCTAVKKGLVNPTIYALVRYPINGKKIGSTTAMEFLQAMNESGLIQKIEKGGKTTYVLT